MDEKALSKLNFRNYLIKNINFKLNEKFDSEEVELNLDFENEIDIDEKDRFASVSLKCSVFKDCNINNYPFTLEIEMIGYFSYESNISKAEISSLLNINATAILFPYLRSVISNITTNSGLPPLIIPTLNIAKSLEEKNKDKPSN